MISPTLVLPTEADGTYSAIDLFCGAGGVTEGFENTEGVKVMYAINHSPEAIAAHKKNNPDVLHLIEDIRKVKVILPHLPRKINILWASAECTNHSNAKGGQSRDPDSRSLPDYLNKYIAWTNPDVFYVENVKEFLIWGPLRHKRNKKTGRLMYRKPCKKNGFKTKDPVFENDPNFKGIYYNRWVNKIKKLGYTYEYRLLNSADWGVHTSRTRYFGVFVKKGLVMAFPTPTHSKFPEKTGLPAWLACREKINLEEEGESIFGRTLNMKLRKQNRKDLSPKSMARCAYGIKKFCLKDFISKNFNSKHQVSSLDAPLHNVDTHDRHMKIKLKGNFLVNVQQHSDNRTYPLSEPAITFTTNPQILLFNVDKNEKSQFISQNFHKLINTASSIDKPLGVTLTRDEKQLFTLEENQFVVNKESGERNVASLDNPAKVITKNAVEQLITLENKFLHKKYSAENQVSDINAPYHTAMTDEKTQLMSLSTAEQELNELRAKEKRAFFFKYFDAETAEILDQLITDIKARYLTSYELADITGFKKYTFLGTSETMRKKHIGNAVPPKMSEVLTVAFLKANANYESQVIAI